MELSNKKKLEAKQKAEELKCMLRNYTILESCDFESILTDITTEIINELTHNGVFDRDRERRVEFWEEVERNF